jgi:transcriptional regulator of acetoin/glycerol metabolism
LRERRQDIPALIRLVTEELTDGKRKQSVEVDPVVLEKLQAYAWPGNIRELRNLMESMLMFRSNPARILITDLPPYVSSRVLGTVMAQDEPRIRILDALTSADWNKSRAARILHCSRMTLYRRMVEYGIASQVSA